MNLVLQSNDNTLESQAAVEEIDLLLADLKEVCRIALKFSKSEIISHTAESLERFRWMPADTRASLLKRFSCYKDTLVAIERAYESGEAANEKDFLRLALWKYGMFVKDDVYESLRDGDIIEVYDAEGIQIYRNFEIFKVCRYSLLELLSFEWFLLYDRPTEITGKMMEVAMETLGGKTELRPLPGGSYYLREKRISEQRTYRIEHGFVAASMGSDGLPHGVLTTMRASIT